MTEEHKKLYEKFKKRKNFKIDYNGKLINVLFNKGFLIFDNIYLLCIRHNGWADNHEPQSLSSSNHTSICCIISPYR